MNEPKHTDRWRLVPIADYEAPRRPGREAVRGKLAALWKRLLGRQDGMGAIDEARFGSLSPAWLDKVTPDVCFAEAAESFVAEADALAAQAGDRPLRLALIGPPGDCYVHAVREWAERKGGQVVEPPSQLALLESGLTLEGVGEDDVQPLVIPDLALFYTRTAPGLSALRELLQWIEHQPRDIVIGCNSWAWAYLVETVQVDAIFRNAFAFAPRGGEETRQWLAEICSAESGCPWAFRFAWNEVSAFGENGRGHDEAEEKRNEFFANLAAASLGIPRITAGLWREALRVVQHPEEDGGSSEVAMSRPSGGVIWIQPLSSLKLPRIWAQSARLDGILLHTLLLHSGLTEAALVRVVPFNAAQVTGSLMGLERRRLITQQEGVWRVTELGYPAVRDYLSGEGFLTGPC